MVVLTEVKQMKGTNSPEVEI